MTLLKTTFLSLIATTFKMLSGLVINKAIAVYIGPSGLATIGQLQSFIQIVMIAAQGAINTGVTKYTAEYEGDIDKLSILFSTASKICFTSSIIVGTIIGFFSKQASLFLLKSEDYNYIFLVFSFTIILFVVNNLLLTILNGLGEIKNFILINIIQSVYSLVFTTALIILFGFDGALIALVTNQSVIFFVVLFYLRNHLKIQIRNFIKPFDNMQAKALMGFAFMAIVSAITIPISHLVIREYIGATLNWDAAGYWQAIWYVSAMYLMVVTTTLRIYYLPKLSKLDNKAEIIKEITRGYLFLLPITLISCIMIYCFRDFIISILFSKNFLPIKDLFLWQLVGDSIRISCFLLGNLLLAKAMFKVFIIKEIIISTLFLVSSIFCISTYGLIGITYAYVLTYTINLIWLLAITKSYFKG